MKLRIKGNSIRLRLSKPEIDKLNNDGILVEKTTFPTAVLMYVIKASTDETIKAGFEDGNITVSVPLPLIKNWATSNEVSLQNNIPEGDTNLLRILVEKDFKCLDTPVYEDQSDYFDNPHKAC